VLVYVSGAAVVFVLAMGRPVEHTDEAWFLWVAHRLAHGDVLYRDVYSVTTPLSHWVAALAVLVTGTEVATIRVMSVACFVATAEFARRLVARSGVGHIGQAVLCGALFVLASPAAHFVALYSGLAVALAMAAWVVARSPLRSPRSRSITVGALCALSYLSKPNIGGVAFLASALCLALPDGASSARRCTLRVAAAALAFTGVLGAAFAVLFATGSWAGFVDQTMRNKPQYLALRVSYLGQVRSWLDVVGRHGVASQRALLVGVVVVPLIAVLVVLVALVTARGPRRAALPTLAYMGVGFVALVPRPTPTHAAAAAPFLVAGMVLTWKAVHAAPVPRTAIAALGAAGVAAALVVAVGALHGDFARRSTLAPFALAPATTKNEGRLWRELTALRRATGGTVFIVQENAGYLYLAGDLHDPTRFDIPERTDFGANDQQTAIAAVRARPPRYVCLLRERRHHAALEPRALERYLRSGSVVVPDAGLCRLRRLGAAKVESVH